MEGAFYSILSCTKISTSLNLNFGGITKANTILLKQCAFQCLLISKYSAAYPLSGKPAKEPLNVKSFTVLAVRNGSATKWIQIFQGDTRTVDHTFEISKRLSKKQGP